MLLRVKRYTTDDFVIMETTNSVYNKSLYDLIQPNCALTWQRVQVRGGGVAIWGWVSRRVQQEGCPAAL